MCSLGPHPNFKSNLSQRLPRWVPCVRFPHDPRGLPHAFACRFHKAFPGSLLCASSACVPIMFPVLRNASPVRLDAFFGTFIRSFLRTFPVQSVRSTAYPVYSLCFSWTIPSSFPRVLSPFTPTFYVRSSTLSIAQLWPKSNPLTLGRHRPRVFHHRVPVGSLLCSSCICRPFAQMAPNLNNNAVENLSLVLIFPKVF